MLSEVEIAELDAAVARGRATSGWTFADIEPRQLGPPLPWDYMALAREAAAGAGRLLDLGTGGGERFAEILGGRREGAVAIESWARNVPVAARALRPLGVDVLAASSLKLPFADASFDCVLSRHEEISCAEIARVLRPGGVFITQQVGRRDWQELGQFFPEMYDSGDLFTEYLDALAVAGLIVERAQQHQERAAYRSPAAFVQMLGATPYLLLPLDFVAEGGRWSRFFAATVREDGLVVTEDRYLLTARKPT